MSINSTSYTSGTIKTTDWSGGKYQDETQVQGSPVGLLLSIPQAEGNAALTDRYSTDYDEFGFVTLSSTSLLSSITITLDGIDSTNSDITLGGKLITKSTNWTES